MGEQMIISSFHFPTRVLSVFVVRRLCLHFMLCAMCILFLFLFKRLTDRQDKLYAVCDYRQVFCIRTRTRTLRDENSESAVTSEK